MSAIITTQTFYLQPTTESANAQSQLKKYNDWCAETAQDALQPDLMGYRDYLLETLKPQSVRAALSHVRQAYKRLLLDRDFFYSRIPSDVARRGVAEQYAFVSEWQARIKSAIDPDTAPVKVPTVQDSEDSKHLRLTKDQASQFLNSFGVDKPRALRNTAIVGLMLCTGIREGELVQLTVDDLRQQLGGELALRIRHGKGDKKRLVPFGNLAWVLAIVDKWLSVAGIESGRVFPLTTRAVQKIVTSKKVMVDGRLRTPRPHDLRRSYAKLMYLEGMPIMAIKDNLGHADIGTTQRYIGTLDASERQPANVYQFDLSQL